MAPRIFTEIVTIGAISIFQVSVNPNGALSAPLGSVAVSNGGTGAVYQNTDGAMAWSQVGGLINWSENGGGDLYPNADGTQDLGLASNRVDRINARQLNLVDTAPAAVNPGIASPFMGAVEASGPGTNEVSQYVTGFYAPPVNAMLGTVVTQSAGATARMQSYSVGGIVAGYVNASDTSTAEITLGYYGNSIGGGMAMGQVHTTGNANALITAFGQYYGTSMSIGDIWADTGATSNVQIRAFGSGSLAMGRVGAPGRPVTTNNNQIVTDGPGTVAIGFVEEGRIRAGGYGSWCMGYVNGAGSYIATSQAASIAFGCVYNGYRIRALGRGSFAFGRANTGSIESSGESCLQIGEGLNAFGTSVQVGDLGSGGINLNGLGVSSGLNGAFWVSGGNVYVRTGGVTKNMSNIP